MSIHDVEISLLTGTWSPPAIDGTTSLTPIIDLARTVCEGKISQVLTSSLAREFFQNTDSVPKITEKETSPLSFNICSLLGTRVVDADARTSAGISYELLRLALAVACLHSFVQANWTGPDLDVKPFDVLDLTIYNTALSSAITEEDLNARAIAELAHRGEPAYHLAQHATFLRISQILFSLPYQYCQSIPWWILRVNLIHQQVLDEPSIVSEDVRTALTPLFSTIARGQDLSGRLFLEQGLLEHIFSRDKIAADMFVKAARATGLEYELTGALGRRTKFQETDLSQLVLLAESRKRETKPEADIDSLSGLSSFSPNKATVPETLPLNDDTLLEKTEFTSSALSETSHLSHIDPSSQPPLDPLDQCILLSMCLNVRNTSPIHGLTTEQMAPYVDRVVSHPQNWSIHSMALLLRTRLESTRTRTIDRSTLQLQALVDQMPTSDSSICERLLYFYAIPLPSKWDLERELALRFASLGVVKSALEIFERLEMWEEVIQCWQSMERKDRALSIVRDLLAGKKQESDFVLSRGRGGITEARRHVLDSTREAKLWCILGDLEPERAEQHYQRAWEISKQTSARAMRSLGGYYFARGNYGQTITSLRAAVRINPLLSRSWFLLGCACVREEDWESARDAFARCVAIDDEDGESWSNLASTYLRMGDTQALINTDSAQSNEDANDGSQRLNTRQSVPFSNKLLAFRALKQGLRSSYDNWRMWNNYMVVSLDVGELSEACRALGRVVEERSAKDGVSVVDLDVLERLVEAATRASPNDDLASEGGGVVTQAGSSANEGPGLLRSVLSLLENTILPRVSSPRIFRAYGKLLTGQGRWDDALKAYLDGYRAGVAGTMEKGETDMGKWREAVQEVEDIVSILTNFGPRASGEDDKKWRLQARSILRTFMGRAKEFEGEAEWEKLEELQEELRSAGREPA